MMLEIYGASDDLIEVEGDVHGEHPASEGLLFLSDGTILEIRYGKGTLAVWEIKLIEKGDLFATIVPCFDEDADRYSDTAKFEEGIDWVYFTKEIHKVQ